MSKTFSELAGKLMEQEDSQGVSSALNEILTALESYEFPGKWSKELGDSVKEGTIKCMMCDEKREILSYGLQTLQARINAGQ